MNGLIIQWGTFYPNATRADLVLPLAFSSNNFSFTTGEYNAANDGTDTQGFDYVTGINKITDGKTVNLSIDEKARAVKWFAIGY